MRDVITSTESGASCLVLLEFVRLLAELAAFSLFEQPVAAAKGGS